MTTALEGSHPNTWYPTAIGSGKAIRLGRLIDLSTGRGILLALSHSLFLGPSTGWESAARLRQVIRAATAGGATGFVVSPGMLPFCVAEFVGRAAPGLILQLDWTNMWRDVGTQLGFVEGRNALIATVEQAARMGADGVMTYLFIGLEDPAAEAAQIELNARISRACEEYGLVRIMEPMARGRRVGDQAFHAEVIQLHARMAAELGADIIKTDYSGDETSYRSVVESCPVPIFIAGGPRTASPRDALAMVDGAIRAGARGVVFGRNIVQAENPQQMTAAMARIIHHGATVDEALQLYTTASVSEPVTGGNGERAVAH